MSTWVIGDIHGCYYTLMSLLDRIAPGETDTMIFLGDYVNKGRHSLDVLRQLYHMNAIALMGNHDLSWVRAIQCGIDRPDMNPFSRAKDRDDLSHWLTSLPWAHVDEDHHAIMVHAGVHPSWTLQDIKRIAEYSRSKIHDADFLSNIYHQNFEYEHVRNAWMLLNVRYFQPLDICSNIKTAPPEISLTPWFDLPHQHEGYCVCFGHWARLEAQYRAGDYYNLDGGAAYGKYLVAMCLDTKTRMKQAVDKRDIYDS